MILQSYKALTLLLALSCMTLGCVESQQVSQSQPFETKELEACLAIVVDMSGSFSGNWDDKAYKLFLQLMDQYFTDGAGDESRIVIGQLSGNTDVILFEGRPNELRQKFRSPEELNQFLETNSTPDQSPVYQSTARAIDYVSSMPGITEKTKLVTVVLSDMIESEANRVKRSSAGTKMVESLKKYQAMGGGIALYYVAPEETQRWSEILDRAGFESGTYVIESTLVAHPQLPRFD